MGGKGEGKEQKGKGRRLLWVRRQRDRGVSVRVSGWKREDK